MKPAYFFFLACLALAIACAPPCRAAIVARVLDGESFALGSGGTVRLAAIWAPYAAEPGRSGEPLGQEAKALLETLVTGKDVRLGAMPATDRHGRILAQVTRADGVWIQAALVQKGLAMVYPFKGDDPAQIRILLADEARARGHRLGIWATPYFRAITPDETDVFLNRYKLIEGRVISVHPARGHVYINFYDRWKGRFAVFVPQKYTDRFAPGFLEGLKGKIVQVRGWIHDHHAPMIDLIDPLQLEIPPTPQGIPIMETGTTQCN